MTLEEIVEFVQTVPAEELQFLRSVVEYNSIMAREGLANDYGLQVGKGLLCADTGNYAVAMTAAAGEYGGIVEVDVEKTLANLGRLGNEGMSGANSTIPPSTNRDDRVKECITLHYTASETRYSQMKYRRCGSSGLLLPAISLGLWHNFGDQALLSNSREMLLGAFDLGITHFDLANNYGPAPGSAEETFGKVLAEELRPHRDELVISTKAGYHMWEGPYGEWGSKKHILSSLDQSLRRMKLDYVDIFYHHRPDPDTPLEETADALGQAVRSGKALYVGISNYNPQQTRAMVALLERRGTPCLLHQMKYSMLYRDNEPVIDVLDEAKVGSIAFSPLAQGLLTDRYLQGIPADSRAAGSSVFLSREGVTPEALAKVGALNGIAQNRGQTLAQMALAWVLRRTTSVIIGASRLGQIADCAAAAGNLEFTPGELQEIGGIIGGE